MTERLADPEFDAVVEFHGHLCLDIALGYRVAKAAMRALACERPPGCAGVRAWRR